MKYLKKYENKKQEVLNHELLLSSSKISALQQMRDWIKKGADVNCGDRINETPLMKSCQACFYRGSKLLIENGADVNILNSRNENALIYLASNGNYGLKRTKNSIKILDLLIENNIDLNVTSNRLDTTTPKITALEYSSFIKDYIKEHYPEKYQEYFMKINAKKYNI